MPPQLSPSPSRRSRSAVTAAVLLFVLLAVVAIDVAPLRRADAAFPGVVAPSRPSRHAAAAATTAAFRSRFPDDAVAVDGLRYGQDWSERRRRRRRHQHRFSIATATTTELGAVDAASSSSGTADSSATTTETGDVQREEDEKQQQQRHFGRRRYYYERELNKPMGLVLEEIDAVEDPENDDDDEDGTTTAGGGGGGVRIVDMSPRLDDEGVDYASSNTNTNTPPPPPICIGDKIASVQGRDASRCSFEQVMEMLAEAKNPVRIGFERPFLFEDGGGGGGAAAAVPIVFAHTNVGVVAVVSNRNNENEILGNVALRAHCGQERIPYDCRSGSCGSCEQKMTLYREEGGGGGEQTTTATSRPLRRRKKVKERYVRPCIGRIPNDDLEEKKTATQGNNDNDNGYYYYYVVEPTDRYG